MLGVNTGCFIKMVRQPFELAKDQIFLFRMFDGILVYPAAERVKSAICQVAFAQIYALRPEMNKYQVKLY